MIQEKNLEQFMKEHGFYVTSFKGVSMFPMLQQKTDRVLIVPPKFPLKKYDVPLYRRGDVYVLHRIVDIQDGNYVIRGDNCLNNEYGITDKDIVGVLSGFWRGKDFTDCTDEVNRRYAEKAARSLPFRRAKVRTKSLLYRSAKKILGRT